MTKIMSGEPSTYESSFTRDRDPSADAQGQAALLLIESLIHSLLDNGALTKAQAIEAITAAVEVKEESAAEQKEPEAVRLKSMMLLSNMRASIEAHAATGAPRAAPKPG